MRSFEDLIRDTLKEGVTIDYEVTAHYKDASDAVPNSIELKAVARNPDGTCNILGRGTPIPNLTDLFQCRGVDPNKKPKCAKECRPTAE